MSTKVVSVAKETWEELMQRYPSVTLVVLMGPGCHLFLADMEEVQLLEVWKCVQCVR